MLVKILSALKGFVDVTDLARRVLDQVDVFRRWLFTTERASKYEQAEQKIAATKGDTSDLENLFQDPSGQ